MQKKDFHHALTDNGRAICFAEGVKASVNLNKDETHAPDKSRKRRNKTMLLRGKAADKYPRFRDYLYDRFPTVLQSKTIVRNLGDCGALTEGEMHAALAPGTPPIIDVVPLGIDKQAKIAVSRDLGFLKRTVPGTIELSTLMVGNFNYDPWAHENMFLAVKSKKLAPVVGGVLLHFLCHWANFNFGITEEEEMGERFEMETYGCLIRYAPYFKGTVT